MFKNHFRDPWSITPLDLGLARIILSVYLIWVILSINWNRIYEYPIRRHSPDSEPLWIFIPDIVLTNINLLVWLTVVILILFALGVQIKYTGYLSSFFVCYFGIVRFSAQGTWSTHMFFAAGILMMLFAVYHDRDYFSVDGLRQMSQSDNQKLTNYLNSPLTTPRFRSTPLLIFLLALGLLYFGSGLAKLIVGGPEWISATNLGRHMFRPVQYGYLPEVRDFISNYNYVLFVLALGTIIIELGFIVSIITDYLFDTFIISLVMFHLGIAILMGPIFVYTLVFLLLFLDWQKIVAALQSQQEFTLVYNSGSRYTQLLYFFKAFDVNNNVEYYTFSNEEFDREDPITHNRSLLISKNGQELEGYEAITELCRHNWILFPIYVPLQILGTSQSIRR